MRLKNFKSIKSEKLNLKSATFIAGLNSAGKSSFTQALIVILQWINNLSDNKKSHIPLNGQFSNFGNNVYDILNRGSLPLTSKEKSKRFATEITLNFKGSDYGYGPTPISDRNNEISIKFTLEPTESSSSSFLLSKVTFDVNIGTRKNLLGSTKEEELIEKVTESWTYDFKSKLSIKDFINNEVINLYLEKVSIERTPARRVKEEYENYEGFKEFLLEVDDELKNLYTL